MPNPDYSPLKTLGKGLVHGLVTVAAFLAPLVLAELTQHPVDISFKGVVIPASVTVSLLVMLNNWLKNR